MGAARQRARLPWGRLLPIIGANLWVFISVGIVVPLLPRYVQDDLGGGGAAIGATFLAFAVASVAVRPPIGLVLRTVSARAVMTCGGLVLAASVGLSALADSVLVLSLLRLVSGLALGAFASAATLLVVQITPVARRGEGISYFSVGLFLGVGIGPPVGEWLLNDSGATLAWLVAGGCGIVAAVIAFVGPMAGRGGVTAAAPAAIVPPADEPPDEPSDEPSQEPGHQPRPAKSSWLGRLFHPAALWPGAILALSIAGNAGFQAFVPVYGPHIGLAATAPAFVTNAVVTLAIRILGGPFVDRFSAATLAGVGCALNVGGLTALAVWPAPAAVYLSAVFFATGVGLLYPALLRLALDNVSSRDQGPVVATYSGCFDLGQGLGAAALGLVVGGGNYRPAFMLGTLFGLLGLVVHLSRYSRLKAMRAGRASARDAAGNPSSSERV